ncbi:MAG: helix-turn-helix domain-containing protein [Blastocatellia bacterium]
MSLTLGEKLRQAREERGISISEVAEQTRISSLYLESIENDDYKPLPGGIFNKGFVKSYARYVGVDEHEALQDYSRIIIETEGKHADELKVYKPEVLTDDRTGASMLPTIIFAGFILALMTGGVLFLVDYIQNQPDSPTPAANNSTNSQNANSQGASNSNPAVSLPSFNEIKIDLKALNETVNVTSTIDGKKELSTDVLAGTVKSFTANESLKLSYYRGYATMVELTLNGKRIASPPAPLKGNAIIFEINKSNAAQIWQSGEIVPPVAAATPTPLPTGTTGTPAPTPLVTRTPVPVASATPAVTVPVPSRTPVARPTAGASPASTPN